MAASRICSIGSLTPNPGRADREIDGEGEDDADQVREQVVQAEPGEELDDDHVDQQRDRGDQAVADEPTRRRAAIPEGPHLVEQVVVQDRGLDRGHRGR
jgi:hypothetical protein